MTRLLGLIFAFGASVAGADDAPREFGHSDALPAPKSLVFSVTPDRIMADAEAWKAIGADGFFLEGVASEWSSDIWATDGKPFTIGASDETFQKVKRANEHAAQLGMVNFLKVVFANPLEWFNDTAWQHIDHHFRQFAIFARDTGCKGVALDIEYIGQQYAFDWPGYDYKDYTRRDLIEKIRERATGIVSAMYDEFPDMEILVLPEGGFTLGGHIQSAWIEEAARRDAPGGVHFCMESTYTAFDLSRMFAYGNAVNRLMRAQLTPAAQGYWQAQCSLAAGMWPTGWDYMPNHDAAHTPAEWRENWAGSLMISPKYNWIYVDRFGGNHLGRDLDTYKGKSDFAVLAEVLRTKEIAVDAPSLELAKRIRSLSPEDLRADIGVAALPRFMFPQGIPTLEMTSAAISDEEAERAWFVAMDYYHGVERPLAEELNPVRAWRIIGPFVGSAGLRGHDYAFAPEQGVDLAAEYDTANGTLKWEPYWMPQGALGIDFKGLYAPSEHVSAYALTYVRSPVEQTVQLRFGSNDSGKVWVGGALVNDFNRESWCVLDRDIVTVKLPAGEIPVLCKVTTGVGAWALTLRFTDDKGRFIKNLTYSDTPTEAPDAAAAPKPDDYIFIRMGVDKKIVKLGEPVTFWKQLWRIRDKSVTSGPYRGSLMVESTFDGFDSSNETAQQFVAQRGAFLYDVSEVSTVLRPSRTGTLAIGPWHWEGITLVNRTDVAGRDRINYQLDAEPIDITVHPEN